MTTASSRLADLDRCVVCCLNGARKNLEWVRLLDLSGER